MYKDRVYMISTKNSAAGMRDAAPKMASLSMKLAKGEPIGPSVVEGYLPNGIRVNFFEKERGSKRAVNMLLSKLSGKSYTTEYPMPAFDRVDPRMKSVGLKGLYCVPIYHFFQVVIIPYFDFLIFV